ncbi:hypothetical protein N8Z24_00820, partial [bacterium]|nr:hypothetical protein [bacterium]
MAADSYILSFDFSEITRQISDLQSKYADLSSDFKGMSETAVTSVENLQAAVNGLNQSLEGSIDRINAFYSNLNGSMKGLEQNFSRISQHSKLITKNIGKLSEKNLKNLKEGDTAAERMGTISGDDPFFKMQMSVAATTEKIAQTSLSKAESAIKAARKALEESK